MEIGVCPGHTAEGSIGYNEKYRDGQRHVTLLGLLL